MRRFLLATIVAFVLLGGFSSVPAFAQYSARPGGIRANTTPVYSPYINLLRSGSFTNNYFGLVQPEQEWRNSVFNLQTQASAQRQGLGDLSNSLAPTTGHPTYFLNSSRYFLTQAGAQGGGGRSPAPAGAPRAALGGTGGGTGTTSRR
jgi:hypothetical protein